VDKLLKLKDRIVAKVFRILTLNIIFPLVYKIAARKPVDNNKVVFIELRMEKISNSFKVVFDELVSKYNFEIHTHFLLNGTDRKYVYLFRCVDMLKDIATAKYVFLNEGSNCIGSIDLRPETKIAQLWHGCGAFKKFGLSTADLIFGESRKQQLRHPFNKNYSLVTTSSPEVNWAYAEAMNIKEDGIIQATGCSRTDVFYDEKFIESAYQTLYEIVPEAKGKKIILYAPTFRGRVAKATTSRMLDIKMFYENFKDEYFLLFKHHPHAKKRPIVPEEYENFAKDVTKTMEIEDLLCVSDVCITDYSSLVFEYSLFEKPIIFFAYDLDVYFDWRGFYYDYFEMSPGPVCTTNLEMIDYIKNLDTRFDKQKVKDFRYKFMRSCDGHSTERILEILIGKEQLASHKKENDIVYPYNTVPNSKKRYKTQVENRKSLQKNKEILKRLYEKYSSLEVEKGKIVLLDCGKDLNRVINAEDSEVKQLKSKKLLDAKQRVDAIKELATAEYIIIDKNNKVLNLLTLKDDTNVVFVPKYSFPFKKFGYSTLKLKSGLESCDEEVSPTFKKVDFVASSCEIFDDIYCESLGVEKSAIVHTGSVMTDCFSNKKVKESAIKKAQKLCGDLNGKKIIVDFVDRTDALEKTKYETDFDRYAYEYLNKDYVIFKYFIKKLPNDEEERAKAYTIPMSSYTKGFFDISRTFTPYEAIAIADVIVGAFSEEFFASFATGKPIFAFAPFASQRLREFQTNFKYEAVLPCKIFDDAEQIVKAIMNVENYDYAKLNKFNETFVCNDDGKATQKLLRKLGVK